MIKKSLAGFLILAVSFVLCTPRAAFAQSNKSAWENLSALQAGKTIQVVEMNSKKHSGTFVNVSDTAISYQKTASAQTIQKQDVRSVKLMENKFRLRTRSSGVEWALVREL